MSSRTIRSDERGIALVIALFMTMMVSALAASMAYVARTETLSSQSYTTMAHARYGAESGLQKAANYLMNSYTPPATGGADPLTNYDMTKSPVTYFGQPVVLSANQNVASNYPVDTIQTAFAAAVQGTMQSGTTTVTYQPYATLLSMQPVNVYGEGVQKTIQTWQIKPDGSVFNVQLA